MDKKFIYLTGGKFNQRKIVSYSDLTRPTSQKVRLAIFNSLFTISGVCLDLFAGSGAYGFEALSRGASFCYLNDNNNLAIKSINENLETLKVKDEVKLTKLSYLEALDYYNKNNITFDLVFLDPPYLFSDEKIKEIFNLLNIKQKKGMRVVLERTSSSSPLIINNFLIISDKKYGSKCVYIYEKE